MTQYRPAQYRPEDLIDLARYPLHQPEGAAYRELLRALDLEAGALVVFRGRTALHRVIPVEGEAPRLLAVLSYDPEPGKMLTEHTRKIFYGRVA